MDNNFEGLKVWQKAHMLTLDIYKVTAEYPPTEMYGLISQLRRSASSIPANIVEGYSRGTTKQYINFLHIANGSLSETRYFIILSKDLGYLSDDQFSKLENECKEIGKILQAIVRTLNKREK